ncbi:MAG: class I SAM-dependent methyltransferase [Paracoccaceae bacterium]
MNYIFTPPATPSLSRWRTLYGQEKNMSVLRALEYEALTAHPLSGRVLDVGGGANARYMAHVPANVQVDSVNIDPAIKPTYLIKPGDPFPVADNTYDYVICMNTLEHVYDGVAVLKEIHRVLKPGGTVYVTVPFIFRIHAHPDDYFRATPSWWRESFDRVGFASLTLLPLVWGRQTSAGSISGYGKLLPRFWFHVAHLKDLAYAKVTGMGATYDGRRGERICATSNGWFMAGVK